MTMFFCGVWHCRRLRMVLLTCVAIYLTVVFLTLADLSLQQQIQQQQQQQQEQQLHLQQQLITTPRTSYYNAKIDAMLQKSRLFLQSQLEAFVVQHAGNKPRYDALALPLFLRDSSEPDHDTICRGPDVFEDFRFKRVSRAIFVFSAFLDHRVMDFEHRSTTAMLRLIVVMQANATTALYCRFRSSEHKWSVTIPAHRIYENAENHRYLYGAYTVSCAVPSSVHPPCVVWLAMTPNDVGVPIRVHSVKRMRHARYNFTVCIPALFGNVDPMHIIEFIELSRLLGADHFIFYDYSSGNAIRRLLAYYQHRGLVTVVPWPLGSEIAQSIWNYGQSAAIQDCLFRTIGVSTYTVFEDFDEYLMPYTHATWGSLIASVANDNHCGYTFSSSIFDTRAFSASFARQIFTRSTANSLRAALISEERSKCVVRPERIFEQGIHHVSKPVLASMSVLRIPAQHALIHHHRKCNRSCTPVLRDVTALRYTDALTMAVFQVLQQFNVV